ncbi:anti-sigma factor family protein [Trinickia sp.]|uniref:anti-sigma factor family protein n=1 Tax=Trinickia sp. TaxID=2571163 RepID=UPI003F7EC6DA
MTDDLDTIPTGDNGEPDIDALSAFVDGELPEARRRALAERLGVDPRSASLVTHYRAQRAALRALFADPAAQANGPCVVVRIRTPWWRKAALAAGSLAAGIALAWLAGALPANFALRDAHAAFARQASLAYSVYAPDPNHAVEMSAPSEAALVAWLSKRLNRSLSVPSLGEYGYAFLGGRLLPGVAGPAAQFMYENRSGERLALYVSAVSSREAPVRLLREGDRRTFYWVSSQTAYALSGEVADGRLREIAADVCGDLGGHPDQWR